MFVTTKNQQSALFYNIQLTLNDHGTYSNLWVKLIIIRNFSWESSANGARSLHASAQPPMASFSQCRCCRSQVSKISVVASERYCWIHFTVPACFISDLSFSFHLDTETSRRPDFGIIKRLPFIQYVAESSPVQPKNKMAAPSHV